MFLPRLRPLKGHERSYGSCKMQFILYRAQRTNVNILPWSRKTLVKFQLKSVPQGMSVRDFG